MTEAEAVTEAEAETEAEAVTEAEAETEAETDARPGPWPTVERTRRLDRGVTAGIAGCVFATEQPSALVSRSRQRACSD